jgi:PIN domain nuclease of toxin-antitoxin system
VSAQRLADACALLDFPLESPRQMTPAGNAALQGDVLVSPIAVWELTRKESLGQLRPLPRVRGRFAGYLAEKGFLSVW